MRNGWWIGVFWIVLGCAEPSSGPTAPTPEAPPPQGPAPTPPAPAPAPTPAGPAGPAPFTAAGPERAPIEFHVPDAPERANHPNAPAWLELARAAFGTLPERFRLRITPHDLLGVELAQLEVFEDADGRSGTSSHPVALVRHREGAWSFVHVLLDFPQELPVQPVRGLADTRFAIASCDRPAQAAVLAVPNGERAAQVRERCQPFTAEIAGTFLERAQDRALEMETRRFLQQVMHLIDPGSFVLALRRSEVPRDVRWRSGASYVGWQVDRRADNLSASGTFLFGRTWYRFALRARADAISLELAILAAANSHGVPP